MPDGDLSIGELARATGTKVPTIRYYEQIGLLPPALRTEGNQRRYDAGACQRLGFVRHARALGFPLQAIRDLLTMADDPERSCARADAIAQRQLVEVRRRIVALQALQAELERMVGQCAGGLIEDCRVIEVLSDHAQCLAESHPEAD